jgi:DNA-binding Xre family transcriptional regulator
VIAVRLKDVLAAYQLRTGKRLTYAALAERAGIARATIESLATRPNYNASLRTIARICAVLGCGPGELLELRRNAPSQKRRGGARERD